MEWQTIDEIIYETSQRFKKYRKIKGISQIDLAKRSNVSYGSIKRFEATGEISLRSLAQLCACLNIIDEIKSLFTANPYIDIKEVLRNAK